MEVHPVASYSMDDESVFAHVMEWCFRQLAIILTNADQGIGRNMAPLGHKLCIYGKCNPWLRMASYYGISW